jgi:rubredoxin
MVGSKVVYIKEDVDESVKYYEAEVVKLHPDGNVRVKFVEQLIPPEMDVPSDSLLITDDYGFRTPYINPRFKCPVCNIRWVEVQGFSRIHWDCPDCGLKKETFVDVP